MAGIRAFQRPEQYRRVRSGKLELGGRTCVIVSNCEGPAELYSVNAEGLEEFVGYVRDVLAPIVASVRERSERG